MVGGGVVVIVVVAASVIVLISCYSEVFFFIRLYLVIVFKVLVLVANVPMCVAVYFGSENEIMFFIVVSFVDFFFFN